MSTSTSSVVVALIIVVLIGLFFLQVSTGYITTNGASVTLPAPGGKPDLYVKSISFSNGNLVTEVGNKGGLAATINEDTVEAGILGKDGIGPTKGLCTNEGAYCSPVFYPKCGGIKRAVCNTNTNPGHYCACGFPYGDNENSIKSYTVPAGGSIKLSKSVSGIPADEYQFVVSLDTKNTIAEADENNNQLAKNIKITASTLSPLGTLYNRIICTIFKTSC
ncbi:MAG: hypothetical protein HY362_03015 [Candidatus Aenigmarchaeota archaeon]|nr:hypothetical protein [Candidatus Aenigmarchaeota archaeon]